LASPRQERALKSFSQCEVKVIHSYLRRLQLCCPPESDLAWDWGCCTEAGWDLSYHWSSFQKKLLAVSHLTSPGRKEDKQLVIYSEAGEEQLCAYSSHRPHLQGRKWVVEEASWVVWAGRGRCSRRGEREGRGRRWGPGSAWGGGCLRRPTRCSWRSGGE